MFTVGELRLKQDPGTIAVVGLVIGGAGAVQSQVAAGKQKKAQAQQAEQQRKSEETQQKIRDLKTARERRQLVRQTRQQRAEVVAGAAAGGTLQTSSAQTGAGSIVTQGASAASFLDRVGGLGRQSSIFNINAAAAGSRASSARVDVATGAAFQGLGTTIFQGSDALSKAFK